MFDKALTCSVFSLCVSQCFFGRMYSFMGGGLFCAGIGNILLIVSTATDYWMQYRHSSNYMHQGLWRYCVPGKCMTHTDSIGKTRWVSSMCVCTGTSSFIFISVLTIRLGTPHLPWSTLGLLPFGASSGCLVKYGWDSNAKKSLSFKYFQLIFKKTIIFV